MIRSLILMVATAFAAGLLFTNTYNSLIDAVSWGSDIPTSIQTAREYFKTVNPGSFFRVFSPINQLIAILALAFCWKAGKRIRLLSAVALALTISVDVFTFGYFYPRLDIMFNAPLTDMTAVKTACAEWSAMNWVRSGVLLATVIVDFSALGILLKQSK